MQMRMWHTQYPPPPTPFSLTFTLTTHKLSQLQQQQLRTHKQAYICTYRHTHAHIDKQQQQPKSRERTNISRSRSAKLLRLCAHDANVDVNVVFAIGSPKQHFVARALPVGASRASEPHSVAVAVTVAVASSLFFCFFSPFAFPPVSHAYVSQCVCVCE